MRGRHSRRPRHGPSAGTGHAFADRHGLLLITIADLIRHRRQTGTAGAPTTGAARLPTEHGEFRCVAYQSVMDHETHLAFVLGEPAGQENVLVRVHSECLTGDVFGSRRCDCGAQLQSDLSHDRRRRPGRHVYLRGHEGRGIGIAHKLQAYELQDGGLDTVDANVELGLPVDSREYGIGAQILVDLGITTMRLLTNNPAKRGGLEGFGLAIVERPADPYTVPNEENIRYLRTKRDRLGHLLDEGGVS